MNDGPKSLLEQLAIELKSHIFSFLSVKEILQLRLVNHNFDDSTKDESFWQGLNATYFPSRPTTDPTSSQKDKFIEAHLSEARHSIDMVFAYLENNLDAFLAKYGINDSENINGIKAIFSRAKNSSESSLKEKLIGLWQTTIDKSGFFISLYHIFQDLPQDECVGYNSTLLAHLDSQQKHLHRVDAAQQEGFDAGQKNLLYKRLPELCYKFFLSLNLSYELKQKFANDWVSDDAMPDDLWSEHLSQLVIPVLEKEFPSVSRAEIKSLADSIAPFTVSSDEIENFRNEEIKQKIKLK